MSSGVKNDVPPGLPIDVRELSTERSAISAILLVEFSSRHEIVMFDTDGSLRVSPTKLRQALVSL